MSYDDNNIFAKILRGEIPCKKIFEDDFAVAFADIHPQAPTHVLVIPTGPFTDVVDFNMNANDEEIAGFWRAVAWVAKDCGLPENGFRMIANTGLNGGQEVPHFHVHLLGGRALGPMLGKNPA